MFYLKKFFLARLTLELLSARPKPSLTRHYFSTDDEFRYESFYADFGPLNLAMLRRYCLKVEKKLKQYPLKEIVHYSIGEPQKHANAAYLIGSFVVIKFMQEFIEGRMREGHGHWSSLFHKLTCMLGKLQKMPLHVKNEYFLL